MRKILILIICFIPLLTYCQTSRIFIDTVSNYNSWGWKAIVIQNDLVKFAVMPAIGGRVMQYDLGGQPSLFINAAEIGKTYTPTQTGPWHNIGGYKTWPSPQSRWPGAWPPPPTLDCGNYSFQIDSLSGDSVSVSVTSPIEQWVAPGIQYQRKATAYPGTSRIKMEQTIINQGSQTANWGMWSITQSIVSHPGKTDYENFWVYFPINPNSVYGPSGVRLPDGSSNAWKGEVEPGIYGVQFLPVNKKIYSDPQKGWIAYANLLDSIVYAKTFDVFEGAQYPDSARVTVYVSSSSPSYLEVEVKGPLIDLNPGGGSFTFTENWWAAKVLAPVINLNYIGVIATKLSYALSSKKMSALYGVFYQGTARLVFINAKGDILTEGQSHAVSPLEEFLLEETITIPDSTKLVEVRVYNNKDELVGVLDSSDISQLTTGMEEKDPVSVPPHRLTQNYPNPFNPSTTIAYNLPQRSSVLVIIYNMQGCEVKSFKFNAQSAGNQKIVWNGTGSRGDSLSSGVYLYKVIATSLVDGKVFERSAKMTLLK